MLTYHKTTEEEKYRITAWKYDGDYAVYNSTPYAQQKQTGFGFANPKNHFYSFYDGTDLVGFINLYEEETEVFFGIGAAPYKIRMRANNKEDRKRSDERTTKNEILYLQSGRKKRDPRAARRRARKRGKKLPFGYNDQKRRPRR